MDNAYTILSPEGTAGIGVIGLKGKALFKLLSGFKSVNTRFLQKEAGLYYGKLCDRESNLIDEVLIALEPEKLKAELTHHGGTAVQKEIITLVENYGFKAGISAGFFNEYTDFRGKIFTSIREAKCQRGVKHFLSYLSGEFENRISRIVSFLQQDRIDAASALVEELSHNYDIRKGFLEPPSIFIIGPENAGKSSLFNRILGFNRVIVTDLPGTTRDHVDETLLFNGYPVTLVDTMGFSRSGKTDDEGLSAFFSTEADYLISIQDINDPDPGFLNFIDNKKVILKVLNKSDTIENNRSDLLDTDDTIAVSVLNDTGIDRLMEKIFGAIPGCVIEHVSPGFFSSDQLVTCEKALLNARNGDVESAVILLQRTFLE